MDRYADGDDTAFTVIFAGLAPRVRALPPPSLRISPDLAEEMTQETFLKLHRHAGPSCAGGASFRGRTPSHATAT